MTVMRKQPHSDFLQQMATGTPQVATITSMPDRPHGTPAEPLFTDPLATYLVQPASETACDPLRQRLWMTVDLSG